MYEKPLKAFHAVAVEGGFTAASRALNIGQPTVSTHVHLLEETFGVELFHRRGRTIELTPVGRTLFTITQGLYRHEEEAIAYLHSARAQQAGELRLGAVGPYDVMELLQAFRLDHAGVRYSVTLGSETEVFKRLINFETDVGITGFAPEDDRFHCVFYSRDPVQIIVNRNHPLAARDSITLADLADQATVLRPPESTTRQAFERALRKANVSIRPVMEINSREAIREAIIRGIGIGAISRNEYAEHPDLRAFHIPAAEMYTYAHVVCLAERRNRPLIAGFIDLAERRAKAFDSAA